MIEGRVTNSHWAWYQDNRLIPATDPHRYGPCMTHDRVLRVFGLAGLAIGAVAMAAGSVAGDLSGFVTGYGLLVVLSAAYLLVGLALRALLAHRPRPAGHHIPVLTER